MKILLVDNNEKYITAVTGALRKKIADVEIIVAHTLPESRKAYKSQQLDLIITEAEYPDPSETNDMPRILGLMFLDELRILGKNIPAIVYNGSEYKDMDGYYEKEAHKLGAQYVSKKDPEYLDKIVDKVLEIEAALAKRQTPTIEGMDVTEVKQQQTIQRA